MSIDLNDKSANQTKVLDFTAFKKKQDTNSEFSRARKPLYINNEDGRVSGTNEGAKNAASTDDFGDRLQKIRSSLDRINTLMADLKKLSAHREKDQLN